MSEKLRKKLLNYELKVFGTVGLQAHEYFQSKDNIQPLHYVKFGNPKNQAVLLVHGYGGSAITFFRIIPELMKHFYVIGVDLLGFGASERPEFIFDTFEKTIAFFTTSLVTLLNFLQIKNVIIIGHSLGGFISTHLAALIKERVVALFLVGAAGFTSKNFTDEEFEVMFGKISKWYDVPTEIVVILNYLTFTKKIPLFNWATENMKSDFVSAYFDTATLHLNREERELFVRYYKTVHKLGSCAHNSVWSLVKYGSYSEHPIIRVLTENPDLTVFIYYGEHEWLDIAHVRVEVSRVGLEKQFRLIKNCGHQVFMQNPTEVLQQFYEDYKSILKDLDV